MTAFNFGSPAGNVIVPITNFTKQTIWIPLVLTTDITCPQAGFAVTKCLAQFSADSSGQWVVELIAHLTWNSATITSVVITLPNMTMYNGFTQEMRAELIGKSLAIGAAADSNASTITLTCASTVTTVGAYLSGKVTLKSEPTTYTTAANMVGVANVAAYFPVAAGATPGLVDGNAASWNGVKTFNNDIVVGGAINGNINSRMNVLISSMPTNPPSWETGPAGPGSGGAFIGGVLLPNGKVFAIPCNYTGTNTIYNPTTNAWETGPAGPGSSAFEGGVLLPNGKVFAIPYNYTGTNTIYNPATNLWETGPAGTGSSAFAGGVLLPNGKVFAIPCGYLGTNTLYNPAVVGWPYGQWMLHSMFNKF